MHPLPTIMGAYYRRRGEDRVTEVFATVLAGVPAYVSLLAERVGLPDLATYEVSTQVRSGSTIDLEIRATGAEEDDGWLLWSEHKLTDPLTKHQLTAEATALRARAGKLPSKLVAITLR